MDRLSALTAFVRLVELGTFTAAARDLGVKQSTVSKWIAALEERLGARLVDRTTRHMRVTASGEAFFERAKQILAAYDDAVASLAPNEHGLRGRLRVSVPVVFGRLHVVPYVASFLAQHPELELELDFDDRYVDLVCRGVDVAIRVGLPEDSSLVARTLATTPRRLVASPDYVRRFDAPTSPDALRSHACLLHTGLSSPTTWAFRRGEQQERVRVRGRTSANHSDALRQLAKGGLGIAMLASWLVDGDIAEGALMPLLDAWTLPRAPIQALRPPGPHEHPRVRAFVDHLAAAIAPLAA